MIKKNTLCIIPARWGSKGIKNKNIINFGKKPLIYHTYEFAKKLNFIKQIIISTDSEKYLNICEKFGLNSKKLRPKVLSKDDVLTSDVIKYELSCLSKTLQKEIKYVLILQPTCPFRRIDQFNKAYKKLQSGYDSVISINEVKEHPFRMVTKDKKNNVKNFCKEVNFKPRQDLKKIFLRSGSMYFHKKTIFKKKRFSLGKKVFGIEVLGKYKTNIDTFDDYKSALKFLKND